MFFVSWKYYLLFTSRGLVEVSMDKLKIKELRPSFEGKDT